MLRTLASFRWGPVMRRRSSSSPSCLQPQPGGPQGPPQQARGLQRALPALPMALRGCILQTREEGLREIENPESPVHRAYVFLPWTLSFPTVSLSLRPGWQPGPRLVSPRPRFCGTNAFLICALVSPSLWPCYRAIWALHYLWDCFLD